MSSSPLSASLFRRNLSAYICVDTPLFSRMLNIMLDKFGFGFGFSIQRSSCCHNCTEREKDEGDFHWDVVSWRYNE